MRWIARADKSSTQTHGGTRYAPQVSVELQKFTGTLITSEQHQLHAGPAQLACQRLDCWTHRACTTPFDYRANVSNGKLTAGRCWVCRLCKLLGIGVTSWAKLTVSWIHEWNHITLTWSLKQSSNWDSFKILRKCNSYLLVASPRSQILRIFTHLIV